MNKRNLKIWVLLTLAIPLCFGLGYFFDSQCADGCVASAFHAGVKKIEEDHGGKFDFHFSTDDDSDRGGAQDDGDGKVVEVPSLDGLKSLRIKAMTTDWVVEQSPDAVKPTLTFTSNARWKVKREGDVLSIETEMSGPRSAHLVLPASFQGDLTFGSVAGDFRFAGKSSIKDLTVGTVSGNVNLLTYPTQNLKITTMSGDISCQTDSDSGSQNIELTTVSGNMDAHITAPFIRFDMKSASGDARVQIPQTLAFTYNLSTTSGEFEGMPEGGTLVDEPGHRSYTGAYGAKPASSLNLENVSGNFQLEQVDAEAPNL